MAAMDELPIAEFKRVRELVSSDPKIALSELRELEQNYPDDMFLLSERGGVLIDVGDRLGDGELVREGIKRLRQFKDQYAQLWLAGHLYNLANGYWALHKIERRQAKGEYVFRPDDTPLLDAKKHYREAIRAERDLDPSVRADLHVNFGNCLSGLGRVLEAIHEYDLAIYHDPEYCMAWGNLGIEVKYLASISRRIPHLMDARAFLGKSVEADALEKRGYGHHRSCFQKALDEIETWFSQHPGECTCRFDSEIPASLESYLQFCRKHQLFLNLNLKHCRPVHPDRDCFEFSLVLPIDDQTTFPHYIRVINEIRERFATARRLLFEACTDDLPSTEIDALTDYVDCLDYGVYGVRVGKMKMAFEGAYNVLDKIALLLNRYLDLKKPERNVYFRDILLNNNGAARPEVCSRQNAPLFGLYDVARDLRRKEAHLHLTDLRHCFTHRVLVPHTEKIRFPGAKDHDAYHLMYEELFHRIIELFRLVRSAVIYLIMFIDVEEREKRGRVEGPIAPMPVWKAVPYPYGPDS